ncbi:MAG: LysR family transcriptional regulator [Gammaproteobacteria bacterium]|nr:LysR family transcriptional regulator [Gammaproteobacteria bacterium]
MRLEWLLDLLAIMENDSLNRAAEKRFLSQPAFSRRIRVIEESIGAELLDRTRKPARLKPHILEQKQKIQALVNGISELTHEFKRNDKETPNSIVIACQHAITTAVAPDLIKQVSSGMDIDIRLRSGNRDVCYALLMTKQADIMLIYCSKKEPISNQEQFLDRCDMGDEFLIPVCANSELTNIESQLQSGEINIVAYPSDVFFGTTMETEIFPIMRESLMIRKKTETALSVAALQCALAGVGVAWLPSSLTKTEITSGRLIDLREHLPWATLSIIAVRLNGAKSIAENLFWDVISNNKPVKAQ